MDPNKKAQGTPAPEVPDLKPDVQDRVHATAKGENAQSSTTGPGEPGSGPQPGGQGVFQRIKNSFMNSVGQIVFGMEDGTVSIFGLVFGLAATANSSQAVFLAGATGAAAAAVSMMAGAFLDVESTRAIANAAIQRERREIKDNLQEEVQEISGRLKNAGFDTQEVSKIMSLLKSKPNAMLQFETAFELQIGTEANENPFVQAVWMFLADLVAASIPVIPFAFFPLGTARYVSVGVTSLLLVILGITRAKVANGNVFWTTLETLGIAALAGGAGVGIGLLLNGIAPAG